MTKKPSNLLILLHGLGDTSTNFLRFGRSLNLPQTTVISLEAPLEVPLLEGYQWYPSFNHLGELIEYDGSLDGLRVLQDAITNGLREYPAERIFILGYGQGVEIIQIYLDSTKTKFGGIIGISGKKFKNQSSPTLDLEGMPKSLEEGRRLMEFFDKKLYLRNFKLEEMARVVHLERI